MLIKVTDELWLESRNIKSLCLYDTFRGREYSVCAEEFTLGKFDTEAAAQEFAQSIVDKLNETPSKFMADLSDRVMKELIDRLDAAEAKVKEEATA